MAKRFWFYSDWEMTPRKECDSWRDWFTRNFKGSDEYGHHTFVVPMGKGRAVIIAYRAGYKGFRKCEYCVLGRKQTLDFEADMRYIETYWNVEDALDLDDWQWDIALGVTK
jgi:hypothetical protein